MRTREWRRDKERQWLLSRIKGMAHFNGYGVWDANGNMLKEFRWMDYLGTYTHFMYKSHTSGNSNYNIKWGCHGKKRGKKGYNYNDPKNRITDKRLFKRMLEKEYDIKAFNINYGFIQNSAGE